MINEIVKDLIKESEPSIDEIRARVNSSATDDEHSHGDFTRHCKQIQLCSDSIHLLLIQPWDFLSRLKIGRTFENQIGGLKNFHALPYGNGNGDSLLTRVIRCCNPQYGPDLIEFVIYRPDHALPLGSTINDALVHDSAFAPCNCNPKLQCKMKRAYDRAKLKYDKRKKSYQTVTKTRRTSLPHLMSDGRSQRERGKTPTCILIDTF